nr:hypothetical protein [Tanacetum cinerariifolium]
KIRKEQVKEQVKVKVSKIFPKIEKTVNEQLEAEVLTHSSNSSKTSHVVAADLSELEMKKILIDKMERNKSIYRSDEQKNLYKALVDAYECDKLILDTYGDTVTLKRRQDDEDKYEEPSKIRKEQVKEQVKVKVSKIFPKIEKTVNEQLEAEVLTHSSNSSKTSHVVAADLSELEMKKILIDKMERNKSIYRSDEQKNLYKALVDAYEWWG